MIADLSTMLQKDSINQTVNVDTYKDFFYDQGEKLQYESFIFLILGVLVCFAYVALNKYYYYYSQQEVVDPETNLTKQKFENISLIYRLRFKSIIFKICFSYGIIASGLFLGMALLDVSKVTDIEISRELLMSTHVRWIDAIIGGLVFGFAIYPVLSTKLVGIFGFEWLIDLFANPNDQRILDEITFGRYLEISALLKDLKKKGDNNNNGYGLQELEYQIFTWNDHLDKVDDDEMYLALQDAKEKHGDHLVNISLSLAKTIGFENMRMALKYPVY